MSEEWEIIAHDERDGLEGELNRFINYYLEERRYRLLDVEIHYSYRNLQWEALVKFDFK